MEMDMNSSFGETTAGYADYSSETDAPLCNRETNHNFGVKLSTFYLLIFTLSVVGNSLVLYIICKFEKLNTVGNIFLLNLVVSDLVFMSSLPFWAVYHHKSSWIFGRVWCKIVGSAYFLGFYSSILFLTLMTFDRYLAVVYAVPSTRLRRRSYALASSAAVWGISLLACIKPFVLYDQAEHYYQGLVCEEVGTPESIVSEELELSGPYLQLGLFFLFPLIVVFYCYVRIAVTVISSRMTNKYRTVRLIFVIVLLFFACWTPYNVVVMLQAAEVDCVKLRKLDYALHVTRMVTYLYFCINPAFYTFVGRKFQNHFRILLQKHMPCLKNHVSINGSRTLSHIRNPQVGITSQTDVLV
ncbi:C-C chemokine receptor type 3-like [Oncorhynchus kisutch]|uniref:C-C chemokine receptor type 3-like n=1 Tax=Oncorhynchus kisutch TaxID=8019 RepID=A0A8C7GCT3_ONCKI|nr:C-C chemokine receptor type 3-like [Oncorhynchus kisutch]